MRLCGYQKGGDLFPFCLWLRKLKWSSLKRSQLLNNLHITHLVLTIWAPATKGSSKCWGRMGEKIKVKRKSLWLPPKTTHLPLACSRLRDCRSFSQTTRSYFRVRLIYASSLQVQAPPLPPPQKKTNKQTKQFHAKIPSLRIHYGKRAFLWQ